MNKKSIGLDIVGTLTILYGISLLIAFIALLLFYLRNGVDFEPIVIIYLLLSFIPGSVYSYYGVGIMKLEQKAQKVIVRFSGFLFLIILILLLFSFLEVGDAWGYRGLQWVFPLIVLSPSIVFLIYFSRLSVKKQFVE